jgi:hypothetical protein
MGSHYVYNADPKHVAMLTNNNCHFMTNCCVCRLNITLLDFQFELYDEHLLWIKLINTYGKLHDKMQSVVWGLKL